MVYRAELGFTVLIMSNVTAAPGQTNPPRRILVVDDDIAIRQLSTDLLTRSGFHVDVAEDGAVAWNTLQTNHYDLVVTDHRMPKVSGVQLVKKLRAARMALPVILVSGTLPTEELDGPSCLQLAAIYRRRAAAGRDGSSARDRPCSHVEHVGARSAEPGTCRRWFPDVMIQRQVGVIPRSELQHRLLWCEL
jgi:CheY-like chemotaxis protein